MSCEACNQGRRKRIAPFAWVAAVALGASAYALWHDLRGPRVAPASDKPRVQVAPRSSTRPLVGDPEHGRQLYALNCASCHGNSGDGRGPASDLLWPLPRNHQDAAYMLSRTDDQLFTAVMHGGRGVQRSYLMPAWNDVFDRFQAWNLVAYMRTLTPELPEGVTRAGYQEVYLSEERLRKVAPAGLPRLVGVLRLFDVRPAGEDEEEHLKYLMLFPRVPSVPTTLAVLYDAEGRFLRARTHQRILVDGESRETTPEIEAQIEAARGAMPVVLDQLREDTRGAEEAFRDYEERPEMLTAGARLYGANCGACHGFTGRVLGPAVLERDAWPRVLADGLTLSRLSDDYLRSLIRKGGLHWNLSSVMPANALTGSEAAAIVEHVRTLGEPRGGGACPCSALGIRCGTEECCGGGARDPGRLCPNMRR